MLTHVTFLIDEVRVCLMPLLVLKSKQTVLRMSHRIAYSDENIDLQLIKET